MHKQTPGKPAEQRHLKLNVTLPPDVHEWLKTYRDGPSAGITKLVRWQMERIEQAKAQPLVNAVEPVTVYATNEDGLPTQAMVLPGARTSTMVQSGAFCDYCGSPLMKCECRRVVKRTKLTSADFTQVCSLLPRRDSDRTLIRESRWLVPSDHPVFDGLSAQRAFLLIDEAFQFVVDDALSMNSSWVNNTVAWRRTICNLTDDKLAYMVTALYRKFSQGQPL